MDRDIPKAEVQRQKTKTWIWAIVAAIALAISAWILRGSLKTSIKQNDIRTAIADGIFCNGFA